MVPGAIEICATAPVPVRSRTTKVSDVLVRNDSPGSLTDSHPMCGVFSRTRTKSVIDFARMRPALYAACVALLGCQQATGIFLTVQYAPSVGRIEITGDASTEQIIPLQTIDAPMEREELDVAIILDDLHAG